MSKLATLRTKEHYCRNCNKLVEAGVDTCGKMAGLDDCFSERQLSPADEELIRACKGIEDRLIVLASKRPSQSVDRAHTELLGSANIDIDKVAAFFKRTYRRLTKMQRRPWESSIEVYIGEDPAKHLWCLVSPRHLASLHRNCRAVPCIGLVSHHHDTKLDQYILEDPGHVPHSDI